jgi:ABC-type uncharacterized transport system substrate-binding protein
MRRLGVLHGSVDNAQTQARIAALLEGLRQLGWVEGQNLKIDYRSSLGTGASITKSAAELVALAPEVIVAGGSAPTEALLRVTRSVPIVFAIVPDPLGAGFVKSLRRPGGNVTGFMQAEFNLSGKWLELLKEIAPRVTQVAVLRDPTITAGIGHHPIGIVFAQRGREPHRHSKCCPDRARHCFLCANSRWWPNTDNNAARAHA